MLNGCIYHLLQYYLPPDKDKDLNFLSLHHLASSAILDNEDVIRSILLEVPPHLFSVIFKTAIIKKYYQSDKSMRLPGSLFHLILQWPYEEFSLLGLMPALPPQSLKFKCFEKKSTICDPLKELQMEIDEICEEVAVMVYRAMLTRSEGYTVSDRVYPPFKRVDLSGYSPPLGSYLNPSLLVHSTYLPDDSGNDKKTELIIDVCIDGTNDLIAVESLVGMRTQNKSNIAVIFRKVKFLTENIALIDIAKIFKIINDNNIEFLDIKFVKSPIIEEYFSSLCDKNNKIRGICVSLYSKESSLGYISSFNNLQQLDISKQNIKNKLNLICSLPKGLVYLNLDGAKLSCDDFSALKQSHHVNSLKQLNLSGTNFNNLDKLQCLLSLLEHLPNVKVLELNYCRLHECSEDMFITLLDALHTLPNLAVLHLKMNFFSSTWITSHFVKFSYCKTLKYISSSIRIYINYLNMCEVQIKKYLADLQTSIENDLCLGRDKPIHLGLRGIIWCNSDRN
ncbi:unnamed protein product [Meganyctiphanes norvegica]|uniref:Uncharacterized protein n=1 Tax=Meganyctiphanes norvegica TaxID=48144 RepID=A0AAV2RJG2_MEGNR